jgi:hypothetical protein
MLERLKELLDRLLRPRRLAPAPVPVRSPRRR